MSYEKKAIALLRVARAEITDACDRLQCAVCNRGPTDPICSCGTHTMAKTINRIDKFLEQYDNELTLEWEEKLIEGRWQGERFCTKDPDEKRLVARTEDFVFSIRERGEKFSLWEGNMLWEDYATVDEAKAAAQKAVYESRR